MNSASSQHKKEGRMSPKSVFDMNQDLTSVSVMSNKTIMTEETSSTCEEYTHLPEKDMSHKCRILDHHHRRGEKIRLPYFEPSEIILGALRGRGKFTSVYTIKGFKKSANKKCTRLEQMQTNLKKSGQRDVEKPKFIIKCLSGSNIDFSDPKEVETYNKGAQDLVLEAQFLESFHHPNIIKLQGIVMNSSNDVENQQIPCLILESLGDTLEEKIRKWKGRKTLKTHVRKLFQNKKNEKFGGVLSNERFLFERLDIAHGIASALLYLHDKNIIYRDLKPANLGFDVDGNIQLFDFGLAKQFPQEKDLNEDSFRMSYAGTLRYMAPEVAANKKYNLKADVFSFAVLLWEMLSLQTPHGAYEQANHGLRPFLKPAKAPLHEQITHGDILADLENYPSWPSPIRDMLDMSLHEDLAERPPMMLVKSIIGYQVKAYETSSSFHGCRESYQNL